MKTTGAACVSEELCRFKEEEEEEEEGERQIVSLGDSRIERVCSRLAIVRVVDLAYS